MKVPRTSYLFCLVTAPSALAEAYEWWKKAAPGSRHRVELVAHPSDLEIRFYDPPADVRSHRKARRLRRG